MFTSILLTRLLGLHEGIRQWWHAFLDHRGPVLVLTGATLATFLRGTPYHIDTLIPDPTRALRGLILAVPFSVSVSGITRSPYCRRNAGTGPLDFGLHFSCDDICNQFHRCSNTCLQRRWFTYRLRCTAKATPPTRLQRPAETAAGHRHAITRSMNPKSSLVSENKLRYLLPLSAYLLLLSISHAKTDIGGVYRLFHSSAAHQIWL